MSELRGMLEETVGRLFGERVTKELIEAAERGEWPHALWDAVEANGLTRPHLSEDAGGAGGTWREAFVILRATGRYTVPLPIAETVLGGWLLARAGLPVPDGPLTVLAEPVTGDAVVVAAAEVPWGRRAPHAVFVGADGRRGGLVRTEAAAETCPSESIAREPRDCLVFEGAAAVAVGDAALPPNAVRLYGALVRSAQMAGALEAILAQAVRYAGERVQFGRPIGQFQIIQQELARLAGDVAASGVAAEAAFAAAARADADAGFDPTFEIAVAKTRIGEAVDRATSIAHQTHGAIGFTYEHGLHFATRRLWAWRAEFGSDAFWAGELGRLALGRGADALWPDLTGRAAPAPR
jgi:acyl-CoA dehydrogenase